MTFKETLQAITKIFSKQNVLHELNQSAVAVKLVSCKQIKSDMQTKK